MALQDGGKDTPEAINFDSDINRSNDFFDEATKKALKIKKGDVTLYRQIISPSVSNLAFVGFMMSSYNTVLTQAIQSLWLEKLIKGELPLPSKDVMRVRLNKEKRSLLQNMGSPEAID